MAKTRYASEILRAITGTLRSASPCHRPVASLRTADVGRRARRARRCIPCATHVGRGHALRDPCRPPGLLDRGSAPSVAHRGRPRLPLVLGLGPPVLGVRSLGSPKPAFEGVAAMAALAAETRRVRVGCLVFCV